MSDVAESPRTFAGLSHVSIARQGLALALLIALAGAVSAFVIGQDGNWDLQNYHFYNAWAFVNERLDWDLAPAQLQSYHNPIIELPFYWMVMADWPPRVVAFMMAIPAGVGAFFLAKVLLRLFSQVSRRERWTYTALALVVGVTASGPVSLLGSTMNEWQGAALIMIALWFVLRESDGSLPHWRSILGAGLLSGIASGLKLTAAIYAVGMCVALLATMPTVRRGIAAAFAFGVAVCLGVALTLGPWMWKLYARFDNPVFPYFNNLFHSPWWDDAPLMERVYGPHSLREWLTFPFRFVKPEASFVSELSFSDWRLPMIYVAIIGCGVAWLIRRLVGLPDRPTIPPNREWRTVLIFCCTSFVLWTAMHSIYRYLLPIELLSGAVLIYLLGQVCYRRWLPAAAFAVTFLAVQKVHYPDWWRIPYGQQYFEVTAPTLLPGALVILVDDPPMAYVLPFLARDARFVGAKNNLTSPDHDNLFEREVKRVIGAHGGPIYSLTFPAGTGDDVIRAHRLRRVSEPCQAIATNMSTSPMQLCRLQRAALSSDTAGALPTAAVVR
jgi:hypothetical protein